MPEREPDPTDVAERDDIASTPEELMDAHPLTTLFDDGPRVRILIAFLQAGEPLNPDRVIERAGIGRRTWYNHIYDLIESGLVVESGNAGNSPLYRLPEPGELPEGDDRVEALEKLTDWTRHALNNPEDNPNE